MRRATFFAVLIACVLAASGCGSSVTVRTVSARPATPASVAPFQTTSPALRLTPSPSATVANPSHTATTQSPPSVGQSPPSVGQPAPIVVAGHGPAGSITTTGSDAVALTFDDGPDPKNTMDLLDLLKEQGVKATFCVVGFRARDHPEVIARIAAEGHTLCNHSWQHLQNLSEREDSYLMWDLQSTNDAIHAAAPNAKIEYFRAPYGNFTRRLIDFASKLNMKPIYWSVDDDCWMSSRYGVGPAMTNHMTAVVKRDTRPGGIILSHDNGKPHTIATYRSLLPWLKSMFRLEALPTSQPPSRTHDPRER
ncbi:MAG: putative polysaccharide deacetylase [Dactylosporangium sp.]|nr:putative polysaccharide deacetylase [Dactylosporangium sp.]